MAGLTGTDADVAAPCAGSGWMRWAHSTRDGLAPQVPDITLPLASVEPAAHKVRTPSTPGPGAAGPGVLVPPPVHHHPGVAR